MHFCPVQTIFWGCSIFSPRKDLVPLILYSPHLFNLEKSGPLDPDIYACVKFLKGVPLGMESIP